MTVTLPVAQLGHDYDPPPEAVHAIVARAQAGDSDAIDALYRRYRRTVSQFVTYRMGNNHIAEDIASHTWVRALTNLPRYQYQGRDFGAWLVTIARNLINDHYKTAHTRLSRSIGDLDVIDGDDDDPAVQPEPATVAYLRNLLLLKAVLTLTPDQREAIVLRYLHGLSVEETAQRMGRADGAVKSLVTRAFVNLRNVLLANGETR